jgi:uncharacterized protein
MSQSHNYEIDLLVIQASPFCNIDCKYCYLPDRQLTKRISSETIIKVLENIISDKLVNQHLSIVWHAGEPLALNIDYFEGLLKTVKQTADANSLKVSHSIQTNGMLINDEWCRIINEYDISIGISIDGPSFLHDINRVTRKGKGTHGAAMQGVLFLQKYNIPFHAIAVITQHSLQYPEAFFNFFYDNGFFLLGMNIEEIEGCNINSSLDSSDTNIQLLNFLEKVFTLYKNSDGRMRIREFSNATRAILRQPEILDIRETVFNSHQLNPLAIISVSCDGNFSSFSPELIGQKNEMYNDFVLGNVHEIGFLASMDTPLFKQLTEEISSGISKCADTCEYFSVCGGGAPSNKFFENGAFDSTETMYCRHTIQKPIDIVLKDLELILT